MQLAEESHEILKAAAQPVNRPRRDDIELMLNDGAAEAIEPRSLVTPIVAAHACFTSPPSVAAAVADRVAQGRLNPARSRPLQCCASAGERGGARSFAPYPPHPTRIARSSTLAAGATVGSTRLG